MALEHASTGPLPSTIAVRHDFRTGDLEAIVHLHGKLYTLEYGFDPSFEAYVAGPLGEFARNRTDRDRLWIAELEERIVGSIAMVGASAAEAQLRWFLVEPPARGKGLGAKLLAEALDFARRSGYQSVFLWTVSALLAAAHLYRAAGFRKVQERPGNLWGVAIVEEKYFLELPP